MADEMVLMGKVLEIKRKDKPPEKEGKDWTLYQIKIADHRTGVTNGYGWFSTKGGDLKENHSYEFRWKMDGEYRNIVSLVQEIETPAGSPAATASPNESANGLSRSKEEMRWTASLEMATHCVLTMGAASENTGQLRPTIVDWAEWYYEVLLAAPAAPEVEEPIGPQAPPTPVEQPAKAKADAPLDMDERNLRDFLASHNIDRATLEKDILGGKTWDEFLAIKGATVRIAYERAQQYLERQGVTV